MAHRPTEIWAAAGGSGLSNRVDKRLLMSHRCGQVSTPQNAVNCCLAVASNACQFLFFSSGFHRCFPHYNDPYIPCIPIFSHLVFACFCIFSKVMRRRWRLCCRTGFGMFWPWGVSGLSGRSWKMRQFNGTTLALDSK